MILVTGATGHVGAHVVRQLLAAGEPVRALTRRPDAVDFPMEVDVVAGDLARPASLGTAFDDVTAMFLFPTPEAPGPVTQLASRAGVQRIVLLSAAFVGFDTDDNPIAAAHRHVERAVEASGLHWTFLRPTAFATNTLAWAPSVRAESLVHAPYGRAQISPIHESDIAAVAVAALLRDGHQGAIHELTGPESVTQIEQAQAIGNAIGRAVDFDELTAEQARDHLSRTVPAPIADTMLTYLARAVDTKAEVLPTVEAVTGAPARTFQQWADDHAEDFT